MSKKPRTLQLTEASRWFRRRDIPIRPPFPLDLGVRTPLSLQWRLAGGESFLGEILYKDKVDR